MVEKTAIGVSVTLVIAAAIVLLMVCCFIRLKYSSGEW